MIDIATLDFESYWDQEHTLKKIPAAIYVLHPKTQLISVSLLINGKRQGCVFGEDEIRRLLATVNWSKTAALGHNMSVFDSMILAWRLGIKPAAWLCTLAMARVPYGKVYPLGLGSLVKALGIGVKNQQVLLDTRGKRLEDFTPDELQRMAVYNYEDSEQCWELFLHLKQFFSPQELWHLDCNIRMLVEPEFDLDRGLLEAALSVERSNKRKALLTLAKFTHKVKGEGWSNEDVVAAQVAKTMQSAAQFSALLESLGEEVPMKRSPKDPKKWIPAIAKTDEPMQELLDHDNEIVSAAARARLSVKSTQLETRIQSFLDIHGAVGKLPVPAHYCGADTTGRDSGFWYNMLNLPRINKKKPAVKDALRRSVRAPKGKAIGVCDLSGIELRVNHTLWMVQRSMDLWAASATADLYRSTASRYYDCQESEVQPEQRQFAKVLELSAGFGIGAVKFRQTARIQGGLKLTMDEAKAGINGWRALYPEIADYETGGWGLCQQALTYMAEGTERAIDPWGLVHTVKDGVRLPSGRLIRYPDLRQEWTKRYREVDGELVEKNELTWMYAHGRHKAYLYGGKVDENWVQAIARDIIFGQALQFFKDTGWRPKHKVYDELCYVWPEAEADELLAHLQKCMRTPPKWWPEIVLACEGSVAECYGDAK